MRSMSSFLDALSLVGFRMLAGKLILPSRKLTRSRQRSILTHCRHAAALASSLNSGLFIPSRSSSSRRTRFFHFRTNLLIRFIRTVAAGHQHWTDSILCEVYSPLRTMTNESTTGWRVQKSGDSMSCMFGSMCSRPLLKSTADTGSGTVYQSQSRSNNVELTNSSRNIDVPHPEAALAT